MEDGDEEEEEEEMMMHKARRLMHQHQHQQRRRRHEPKTPTSMKRVIFVLIGVLLVIAILWILGDMLVKRMALQLLFKGSTLPLPPKPVVGPVASCPPVAPASSVLSGGGNGLDLHRDVRLLNTRP